MDTNTISHILEMIDDLASRPLYDSLEVGFRHSPLTTQEKLDRYAYTCSLIYSLVSTIGLLLETEKPQTETKFDQLIDKIDGLASGIAGLKAEMNSLSLDVSNLS